MTLTDSITAPAVESSVSFAHLSDLALPFSPPETSLLDDAALMVAQRTVAEIRRRVDATAAALAAEIQHRSRHELGHDGLAQRLGARTPERLVQHLTGATAREASTLVRVGALIGATQTSGSGAAPGSDLRPEPHPGSQPDPRPWLRSVGAAVAAGELSVEAADAIRAGLGSPDTEVTGEALGRAADALLLDARSLTVEKLAARAREMRLELDIDRVAEREQHLRSQRYLRLYRQADGMTRLSGLLDPESAAIVTATFDAVTSPRLGGPRFVDSERAARAEQVAADDRTTEQLMLDAFVELVRIATAADARVVLGAKRPAIKLLVTDADLRARRGLGFIEGQTERVSIATIERFACTTGVVPILFDDNGETLNLGREQRLFSAEQGIALAARDGGCQFPDCDRPPEWCEAHHIDHWARDGGHTNLDRALLLCRHHHLLVHNNGWEIQRARGVTTFVPPPAIDQQRTPVSGRLSPALTRLLGRAGRQLRDAATPTLPASARALDAPTATVR